MVLIFIGVGSETAGRGQILVSGQCQRKLWVYVRLHKIRTFFEEGSGSVCLSLCEGVNGTIGLLFPVVFQKEDPPPSHSHTTTFPADPHPSPKKIEELEC